MACPYFAPAERMTSWRRPPILPLGDPYTGTCLADPSAPLQPPESELRQCCNMGYAAGTCGHFPQGDGPDAVRFSIARHGAGTIELWCVLERGHEPFELRRLVYSEAAEGFPMPHPNALIQSLAQAYLTSYLRRKNKP